MQVKEVSFTTNPGYVDEIHIEKQQTREKARVVEEAQAEAKERIAKRRLLQKQRLQGKPIRINAVTITKYEE